MQTLALPGSRLRLAGADLEAREKAAKTGRLQKKVVHPEKAQMDLPAKAKAGSMAEETRLPLEKTAAETEILPEEAVFLLAGRARGRTASARSPAETMCVP